MSSRQSGLLITLLLAAALGLRLFVASRMPLIEVDGAYWCSLAGALTRGDFAHGVSAIWPPVYPGLVAVAARLMFPGGETVSPASLEWAGRLVSALAGTLMLWPLGLLALRLLPGAGALFVLAVAAVHPRLIEYSAAALSESVFTLFVVAGLALLVRAEPAATGRPSSAVATRVCEAVAGAIFGLAFMTRSEGLVLGLAVWAAGFARPPRPSRSRMRGAFITGLLLVCGPWLMFLHARSGEWTLGEKGPYNLWKAHRTAHARHFAAPRALPDRVNRSPEIAPPPIPGEARAGDLLRREPFEVLGRVFSQLARILVSSLPVAVGWPVFALALLGLRVTRSGPWWLLAAPLVAVPLIAAPFSADRRFLVSLVPLVLPLAAAAILATAHWNRRAPLLLASALMLSLGVYALGIPARADRAPAQRAAGEWLASQWTAEHRAIVMARKPWVAFYSGGLIADLHDAPPDSILADARRTRVDVLVVDAEAVRGDRPQIAGWLEPAGIPAGWRELRRWNATDSLVLLTPVTAPD
ncbi:MAG: glycosyltransferase family 39 protein [Candidatus Eisenbacteria bacterium]